MARSLSLPKAQQVPSIHSILNSVQSSTFMLTMIVKSLLTTTLVVLSSAVIASWKTTQGTTPVSILRTLAPPNERNDTHDEIGTTH